MTRERSQLSSTSNASAEYTKYNIAMADYFYTSIRTNLISIATIPTVTISSRREPLHRTHGSRSQHDTYISTTVRHFTAATLRTFELCGTPWKLKQKKEVTTLSSLGCRPTDAPRQLMALTAYQNSCEGSNCRGEPTQQRINTRRHRC